MENMEEQNRPQLVNGLELDTRVFAALSYLSILFVVPWIAKREDKFVMFHVRQGAVLFLAEVVAGVVLLLLGNFLTAIFSFGVFTFTQWLSKIAWLLFVAVSVMGVYFAVKGQEKQLPGIWLFAKNLKL
ncbi:hypothetical protein JXA59_00085 [Patescibacteria group bacterium]|nr:hypothetical protein [Patescibacteria group bacterium]